MDASPAGCSTPPPWHIDAVGGRPHHQGGLRREPHGQAAASVQGGIVLGPVGHPVPLLPNVMAISRFGFERHGRDPSVREGAVVLHHPASNANRPIRATNLKIAPFLRYPVART